MLQKNIRKTSSQLIYQRIKDDIIYLRLKPGEEISIQTLAEDMEVSRSPVRDALMKLQSEALVDMLPQRGCWVSKIDLARVDEERLLRISLEKSVLEKYCKNVKASDIARLVYYIELQKEAVESGNSIDFYSADDSMHQVYFEAAGLDRFWDLLMRETGNYRRIRLLSFDSEGIAKKNIEQHIKLVDALNYRNFDKALEIITSHISKLLNEKDAIVMEHPDYFIKG